MANAEAIGRSKVNPRGLPYDPLETVLAGQKELHSKTGPEALLRQKRIAQLKQMPVPRAQRHILEKASSLLPTPLLEANSAGRRKRRLNLPQRLLALTEFKTWMAERFPSPEAARSELRLTTVEGGWRDLFVQALAQRDYPYGTIGAKVFFFFCDADEDDLISWQDITEALEASSGNPGVPPAFPPIALFSSQIAPMANVSDARDMEIPMAATQTAEHQEQEGNVMKELLDRPYINKHTGLDFLVMCFMGAILGLLSIPYCAGVEDIPKFWLRRFGPAGFVEENLELSSQIFFRRGGASWILFCWGFCTAVGVLKVLVKLDKFPSFIDELKHQHVDPLVNLKVVVCCIASLSAGAVMGLEAGLGSVGAALGFLLWKAAEKILPSTSDTLSDQRRRIYILAGLAGAFGTIFPAPVVSVILVSEIATAGTERSVAEEEFMTGRRLPKKVFFYLVPVAVSAFVVAYAVNYAITKSHKIPPPLYDRGYDNLSVFTGVGLGAIAAVAVVIFLLIGALMKAIFTLVGSPLERRLGVPTRQIVTASLAGLITGVAIYLFPLACGSGKDGMMPTRSLSHADKITVAELFGKARGLDGIGAMPGDSHCSHISNANVLKWFEYNAFIKEAAVVMDEQIVPLEHKDDDFTDETSLEKPHKDAQDACDVPVSMTAVVPGPKGTATPKFVGPNCDLDVDVISKASSFSKKSSQKFQLHVGWRDLGGGSQRNSRRTAQKLWQRLWCGLAMLLILYDTFSIPLELLRLPELPGLYGASFAIAVHNWLRHKSRETKAVCNAFVTVMGLLCSLHLLTCLWFGVGRLPGGWVTQEIFTSIPFPEQYRMTLEWSLSRLPPSRTTENLLLDTQVERGLALLATALGMLCGAIFTSIVTNDISDIRRIKRLHSEAECQLADFLVTYPVSHDLEKQLQDYLQRNRSPSSAIQPPCKKEMLVVLPSFLFRELYREALSPIDFCAQCLLDWNVAPHETLFNTGQKCQGMLFIGRGQVFYETGALSACDFALSGGGSVGAVLPEEAVLRQELSEASLALAKVVAYWACAHGGLVGGIFYPLLYFGLTLGEICAKVFHIGNHLVHMAILVKRHVALTFVVLALSVATQVGSGAFQAPGPLLHETVVSSRDARRLKRKWRFQAVTVWGKVCSHPVISRTTALVTWMLHSLPSILTGFSLSPIDAVPQQACHYNSFLLSCAPDLVSPGSELSASAGRDLDFEVQPVDKQWTDSTDLEKQTKLCADASQQHERPCTERGFCRVWPGPAESCSAETARSKPTAVERDPTECPHLDEWCNTVPSQKMHETMTSQPDGCSVPASRMGKSFSDAKILESFSLIDNDDDDQMWTACQIAEYEQHYIPNLVPQKLGAVPRGCETFLTFRAFAPGGCGAFLSHARSAFNSVLPSGRDSVLQAELNSECAFDNTPQIHEAKALQPVPEGADDRSAVSVGTEIMGTPGNNLLPIPDTSNDIGFSDLYVKQGDALQSCHRHSTCAASAHTSHTPPHARAEVEVRVPMPKVFALIAQFAWFSTCIIACGASIAAMLCIASNVAAEPSEATSEANPPSVAQLLLARPALITACLLGIAMLAIMCHMFPGTTNALRVPPAWGPEQEQNYPFRQWTRDVMLWSIASEMDPARKAASVMLVLKGAAKELSRQIPPQAIVDGGLIHGVQVDPLTYLMHALQERFGNLGEEVRVQAITELMGFNRKGNEPIDSLLVRFDSIRSRAAEQGGAIVSVQGVTWILLRAIEISDQQLIHLLTPFHN
eukprot:s696_g4.t2